MIRFALAAFAATTLLATSRSEDKAADIKKALDGNFTVVSGEKDGKPLPADKLKGSVLAFKGNKILGTDRDKNEFFACTYELDASSSPAKITMKSTDPVTKKEVTAAGLIAVDGDAVKLCYALPGGEAMKDFSTKDKQHSYVIKKVAK